MLHWCPTRELCEARAREERWAININKTSGQLSPRVFQLCKKCPHTGAGNTAFFFFFFGGGAFGYGFEGTQKALKKETEIYYPPGQK